MTTKVKKKLTNEEYAKILELAENNVRSAEISRLLNGKVSKQRVHQIMQKHGITNAKKIQEERAKQWAEKMSLKWGENFLDSMSRKDLVYQQMREKFRRKKANNRTYEWTAEFGDLIFPTNCPVLGIELDYFAERTKDNSPSFDRIDNNKGYIKGNVIVCSWRANRIKNDGTAEEHKKIYEFMQKHLQSS